MADDLNMVRATIGRSLEKLQEHAHSEARCREQIDLWQKKLNALGILKEKEKRAVDRAARLEMELIQEHLYVVSTHVPNMQPAVAPKGTPTPRHSGIETDPNAGTYSENPDGASEAGGER